jgi:hypothetical protein
MRLPEGRTGSLQAALQENKDGAALAAPSLFLADGLRYLQLEIESSAALMPLSENT